MNHYCPPKFHAHTAQGLISTGSEIPRRDEPGAEVMNVDRMLPPPERGGGPRRSWWNLFYCCMSVDDTIIGNDNATISAAAADHTDLISKARQLSRATGHQDHRIPVINPNPTTAANGRGRTPYATYAPS